MEYLDGDDLPLTDADGAAGFQVDLAVGENTIKVKVTAEVTAYRQTYTLVITRSAVTPAANALVANTVQTVHASPLAVGNADKRHTQGFTTGSNAGGYNLDSVGVHIHDEDLDSGETFTAHIYTADNNGAIDTLVHTLTSPASYTDDSVNLFDAPANATLDADTDYLVVFQATGDQGDDFSLSRTASDSEDSGSATGWSIEDALRVDSTLHSNGRSFMISVNGTNRAPATDATLSALALQDTSDDSDIALTPTFATATTSYTAMVANGVDQILVDPTTTDDGATVEFLDVDDMAIDDAESMEGGHQVDLAVGDNTIKVKVTAEDTLATQTYEIVVTRAATMPASTLVSNTGQNNDGAHAIGYTGSMQQGGAVRFATGANSGGYDLGDVQLAISDLSGTTLADAEPVVTVREPDTGNANDPSGTILYTMTNPATLSTGIQTFAAPANATLKPNSNYFIVMENASTNVGERYAVSHTDADAEDNSGESDWSIANVSRALSNASWSAATSSRTFRVAVRGSSKTSIAAMGQPAITGTAQVGKTLTAGLGTISDDDGLPATFPDDYSFQWVRVDDDGMSNPVDIGTDDDEYTLVDADQGKQIEVKVSFFDAGSAAEGPLESEAYPAGASVIGTNLPCSSLTSDWCATMTVGDLGNLGTGYYLNQPNGALDDTEFDHAGVTYTVEDIRILDTGDTLVFTLDKFVPRNTLFGFDDDKFLDADATSKQAHEGRESWPLPSGLDAWIDGQDVTVSVRLPPVLTGATVDGDTLVLTYSEALETTSVPPTNAYSVKVDDGAGVAPSNVEVNGSSVTLTLATAVTNGQTVTVSYTVPASNALSADDGTLNALAFTDEAVTNNTAMAANALVSNTGQTVGSAAFTLGDSDKRHTQGFTTGSNAGGYDLDSVGVHVNDEDLESGETFTVHIYTADSSGARDALVHTLTSPSSYTDGGVNLFDAPAGAKLAADTDYMVVFEGGGDGSNDFKLSTTTSSAEDTGAAAGWDIEDALRVDNTLRSDGLVFMISVNGTEALNVTNATGAPAISGPPQVDQTLTAGIGTIADADNLPATFPDDYTFQWVRVDGDGMSNPVDIGTDDDEYTPVVADVGKKILVEVAFTDGASNVETVTSGAYPSQGFPESAIGIVAAKSGCPGDAEWCEEMTVGYHSSLPSAQSYGFDAHEGQGNLGQGNIGDREFDQAGSVNRLISALLRDGVIAGSSDATLLTTVNDVPLGSVFDFGGTEFTIDASARIEEGVYEWSIPSGFGLVFGQKVTLGLNLVPLLTGATVDGDTLVLTYHEDLEVTPTLPAASDFMVTVDSGTPAAPSDVAISGTEVTLTLATAVTSGQTVTVSYTPGVNPVQDESGLEAAAFTDEAVTNNTTDATVATTLVDNTGNTSDGGISVSSTSMNAQGFGTGSEAKYTLTDVSISVDSGHSSEGVSLAIHEADSTDAANPASAALYSLTPPSSHGSGIRTFTAPADAVLNGSTGYFLVVTGGSTSQTLNTTNSTSESGEAGWTITDSSRFFHNLNNMWISQSYVLQMTIRGEKSADTNTAAVGAPDISGPAQVGKTLTAGMGDIADIDGLPTTTFPTGYSFQWMRVDSDGTNPVNVGTDSSTYVPVTADIAKNIKVEVTFTDGGSTEETLVSDSTYAVMPAADTSTCDTETIWCATLTSGRPAGDDTGGTAGFDSETTPAYGSVSPMTFVHGGTTYTVTSLLAGGTHDISFTTSPDLPTGGAGLTLHVQQVVGERTLPLRDADSFNVENGWLFLGGSWTHPTTGNDNDVTLLRRYSRSMRLPAVTDTGTEIAVRLSAIPPNATGEPVVTGAAQVGKTLTAGMGDIADADGLPATFPDDYSLQWIRVDGSDGTETEITGANSQTYSPGTADVGNYLKVRVSFTDDVGVEESLTGPEILQFVLPAAVSNCDANTVWCATLTVGNSSSDILDDPGAAGFEEGEYGSVSPTTFAHGGVTYTVTGLFVAGHGDVSLGTTPNLPSGGAGLTLHLQAFSGEIDLPLADASFNDSQNWDFPGGVDALNPTPLSEISLLRILRRADSFAAQTFPDTEIAVRLSAVPNSAASGKPSIDGAAVEGQTLTASTAGITDADGKTMADNGDTGFAYGYQWIRVSGGVDSDIAGETSETYTLTSADVGDEFKVSVEFTDDNGNAEGPLTSDATATVIAIGVNAVPIFDGGDSQTRDLAENVGDAVESAARDVGAAVGATDANTDDTLTYSLEGTDAVKFDINSSTGQLRTKAGERYDFEDKPGYSVTVKVNDGTVDVTASVAVNLIDNTGETPPAPAAPTVAATVDSYTDLDVTWTSPDNTGRPAIEDYDLRYRIANQSNWTNGPQNVGGTSARLAGLTPDTLYQVQVRASNADGDGAWSASGQGRTGEAPAPEVSFGAASYTALEGVAGATVTVELSVVQGSAVTVPITETLQGGASGADYSGVPDSVTIAAGQTSAQFTVTATADTVDDHGESVLLGFGALPSGVEAGDPSRTTVALVADSGVETWYVFFEKAEYSVTEGGSARVTVGLSNPWKPTENEALTIGLFAPEHHGGATRRDYSGVPGSVTFQPGQTRVSFTVTATDDSDDDDGESILLRFAQWDDEDLKIGRGPYPTTVHLRDNDGVVPVKASFGEHSYNVREGGAIDIEVRLDARPGRALTIPLEVRLRNGAGSSDYTIEGLEATFGANQTAESIEVAALDDNANDDLEYLELGFGELPDKVSEGSPSTTVVNLEDTDNGLANVKVRFDAHESLVREKHEGGRAYLFVYLNGVQDIDVVVPLEVEHLDGATEADYEGVPSTVTIPAGENRNGVSIGIVEDAEDDDGEGIRVGFGDLPSGVRADPDRDTATYRFLDNEDVPQMTIAGDGVKEWSNPPSHLKFIVTLDYIPEFEVKVDYATVDGTAVANQDYKPTSGTLTFAPGQTGKLVWVKVCHDGIDEPTETMTLRLSNPVRAEFREGGSSLSATGKITNNNGLGAKPCSTGIVVSDASARELSRYDQENDMVFDVRLNREDRDPVTVDYRTVDGTATAGQDYDAASGTLRFEPGETEKTVTVIVKPDDHDDPGETFTVELSNPDGAYLGDGEATGTITNSGPMPGAWLSRFGRVAADQAVQSIGERVREGTRPRRDNQFTLGRGRVDTFFDSFMPGTHGDGVDGRQGGDGLLAHDGLLADGSVLADDGALTPGSGPAGNGPADSVAGGSLAGGGPVAGRSSRIAMPRDGLGAIPTDIDARPGMASTGRSWRPPTLRELMRGASFDYSRAPDGNGERQPAGWLGEWSGWGRTAAMRFAGADGPLSINGEVVTATLGFDSRWDRWIGGVALSYSEGEGTYGRRSATGGTVGSSLTSLMPYASYAFDEHTSVWGTLGYGAGDLTLTPEGATAGIETDLSTALAAFGGRGVLNTRVAGIELAWVSDALLTETASDTVQGLNGAAGGTSRLRLMLEGSGSVALAGGVLQPRVEAGLRYDGGDAETGAGIELGGRLGYAAGRIAVQVDARGLVAHEDAAYEEWGFGGSVQYRPGEDGRGLSMRLGSAWGATQSGVRSLWARADASGLARRTGFQAAQRFQAQLGYGLAGGRALWVPFLQGESSGGAQALVLGVRMTSGANISAGLEIGGRAGTVGEIEPAVQLNGSVRW